MAKVRILIALVLLAFVAAPAWAENTISWSSGYPQSNDSGISVAGTLALDSGWSPIGNGTARIWIEGGEINDYVVTVCGSSWSGTFSGLSPGTYKVYVEIEVENPCTQEVETIATDISTVTIS